MLAQQDRLNSLYSQLKSACGNRHKRLEAMLDLFSIMRDIEDLEQWLLERIATASSHELGQDLEHVTVCFRFVHFSSRPKPI